MKSENKFFAHHVGGRAASVEFPYLPKFNEEIVNVIYDADESCILQIKNYYKGNGRNALVLPFCLLDKCGTSPFIIKYDPYASSIFPLNKLYGNYYNYYNKKSNWFNFETDYLLSGVIKAEKVINVNTYNLDYLVEKNLVPIPDFLSLDTEGSELLILEGATQCLKNNIVAVKAEIHLAPALDGAPLFGRLDEFLRKHDFLLASLETFGAGYKRVGKDCRGASIPLFGEALYILKPECVNTLDTLKCSKQLEKLAFAALAFGYTEIAFDAVERLLMVARGALNEGKICKFLLEYYSEVKKNTDMPPLWHETISFEKSNSRFIVYEERKEKSSLKWNILLLKEQPLKYFPILIRKVFSKMFQIFKKIFLRIPVKINFSPRLSPFDSFLIRNGFDLAVSKIHHRRSAKS